MKIKLETVASLLFSIGGLIFISLCIFSDINDDLFLPLALGCIIVSNVINLVVRKLAKKDTEDKG